MDKVKHFFAQVKRHHFWLLTVVAVALGLTGWAKTTGELKTKTATKLQEVEKHFKDVDGVQPPLPNPDKWNTKVQQETARLAADVLAAWTMVYERQSTEVLKWPEIPFNRDGMSFPEYVQTVPLGEEMDQDAREAYSTYVVELFPKLLEIVDAAPAGKGRETERRGAKSRSAKPESSTAAAAEDRDYKVNWQALSQEETRRLLELPALPTTAQVRRVQEDLWVTEAILRVIAEVNAKATGSHNAKIKSIDQLTFGKPAAARFAEGLAPDVVEKLPAVSGEAGEVPAAPAAASTPTAPTGDGGAPSEDDGRYVNETGAPLASAAENPAEFKRIPVFLELTIDQREIAVLLAECAESPLPVEVRQFAMLQLGRQNQASRSVTSAKPSGPVSSASGEKVDVSERFRREAGIGPYDVRVQIAGIIYIYNPPNKALLSVTGGESTDTTN